MDESQTENEKPLLIVKYVWWKVLWRLFFPISIVLLFGAGMINSFLLDIQLGCREQTCSFLYAMLIFWSLITLCAIFLVLMVLLFKEVRIYKNKFEQKWNIFGERIINYQNAYLIISRAPPFGSYMLIKPKEKFYFVYCYIDESLLSQSNKEKVWSILSEISDRNINEFQSKGKTTFDPFIKN